MLDASSGQEWDVPLNRFVAAHEVNVKPIGVYDSYNQMHMSFP